jgi:GAF domain-containing protein
MSDAARGARRVTAPSGFDHDLLLRVLSEFAGTLAGRFEVSEVLFRLTEHVVEILGVAGAGVSVTDEEGRLRRVTAINELTAALESVEEDHQEGPCIDAFRDGTVVVVPRLDRESEKWPEWSAAARQHGIHAVVGVPLRVNDDSLGAMNIYSLDEREWREDEVRAAQVLADMAASYVANASDLEQSRRTAEQLQDALDSRIIIEQAKGALAAEGRISVDEAFDILRDHARTHGATLRAVASAVVDLGLRPAGGPGTRRPRGR